MTYTVVVEAAESGTQAPAGHDGQPLLPHRSTRARRQGPQRRAAFLPTKLEQVRPEDRDIFEGNEKAKVSDEEKAQAQSDRSATERALANRGRTRRHVWVEEGDYLRAVEVQTGINDNQFTELVSGELKPGDKLVTGIAPPKP